MQAKITKQLLQRLTPRERPYEVWDTDLAGFIVRVQPSGAMSYACYYRLRDSGERQRMTLGSSAVVTPQEARLEARKLLADVVQGANPKAARREARKARKQHTLETYLCEVYEPWIQGHQTDHAGTRKRLRRAFSSLLQVRLPDVTAWAIEKWRAERLKTGRKPATVNRDLVTLKSALSKAVEWEILPKHPLARVKRAKTDDLGRIRWLSPDEEKRLGEAMDAREAKASAGRESANGWRRERGYAELPPMGPGQFSDHLVPMITLSLDTGMRRGEVFKLRWSDVDLDRKLVTVRGSTAKSGRTRHIPLTKRALEALRRWKAQQPATELVFPGEEGRPLTNVKKAWQALLKSAQITGFRWHDMRHNFASQLVMRGVDLNSVRELLGHSEITMTLRYAHLAPEFKASAIAKLERVA